MKIRLLTLLFAFVAPMLVFGQTFNGAGGPLAPPGSTSGTVEYTLDVPAGAVAGSTLAGGVCPSTGINIPDTQVPAVLGYNTEITGITLTNVQHTWASDLDLSLIAPDGTEYFFSLSNGGSTGLDAGQDMVFDVTAADCVDDWTSSTSTVQPTNGVQFETAENTCGPLEYQFAFACGNNSASITGASADGTWTLRIVDNFGGDTGTFDGWSLTFSPIATPPADDSFGVAIDVLACCVDVCQLSGVTPLNVPLEAGECQEIALFDNPTLSGGASCKFCDDPALPTFAITAQDNATVTETLGADGIPTQVVLSEGGTAEYTITATAAVTVKFDYEFAGSTFWDPFMITGPGGVIVSSGNGDPNQGSISENLNAGDAIVASVNSADGVVDGSSLTLTNFQLLGNDYPCYKLEIISGPQSGDYLSPGTYTTEFVATPYNLVGGNEVGDPANAITYTQEIIVQEYSGPVSTALACNDHVNISADDDCSITFNADMFLEGGPYHCYDDYEINLWLFQNQNNQTGDINTQTMAVGPMLGTHTYEIIDPVTGNRCWGTVTFEDKLAPSLDCTDYTINCTQNPINSPVIIDLSSVNILSGVSNSGPNTYTVNVTDNFNITDLNVNIDLTITGSQFGWGALLVPPGGADTISLWPVGIGGCGNTIDFIADDQGPDGITCAQFQSGTPSSTSTLFQNFGFPYTPLSVVNGTSSVGTWTLLLDGDIDVNDISLIFNNGSGLLIPGNPDQDACGSTTYTYEDDVVDNGCDGSTITRTWYATDGAGYQSPGCVQTITVENIGIDGITFPQTPVILTCGVGTSPEEIQAYFDNPLTKDIPLSNTCQLDVVENNEGTPYAYPYYFQVGCDGNLHPQAVDNNVCMIYATYSDQNIPACGAGCGENVKVIRTWTLLDWCTNTVTEFTQLIKAVDTDAPTFIVKDITVSTDPWGCAANIDIPQPWELHDNCTSNVDYTVSGPAGIVIVGDAITGYTALNVPKGTHTFTYTASDCCGNTSSQTAQFTVYDGAPPVAIAKQNIVVSLTSSATSTDGYAKIYATSVDNGSFDGCTGIKLEVRREEDACDIRGNATYNADGHSFDGSPNPNSPSYDPDGGAYVKFCCADLTNATVDVNGDGELDPGYVQVWLRVWDDGDMNGVYGTSGDNMNETWCYVKVEDKLPPQISCPPDITITCADDYTDTSVTGVAHGFASCGDIDVEYNDIIVNLTSCNIGFVRRRWNIVGNPAVFCDQTITIEDVDGPDAVVSFSQVGDFTASGCPNDIAVGEPSWIGGPCDVIGYSVETDTFLFEDGACYKLVNYYTVINWCTWDPNAPDNPNTFADGIAHHTQVIKVTDETTPVIENCEPQMYAVDANCEGHVTLTNSATDPGSDNCPTSWLKWTVLVDLWGDGTYDLEFSSHLPPFDNQFNDTNGNGIPDKYLEPTANGAEVSVALPPIVGSMSNHKVVWKVTDGCNNNNTCTTTFMVVDKKAPTPYCVSLSSAVMEGSGSVELWAIDFNVGSFDNCTNQENLRYTFSDVAPEDDPAYIDDLHSSSRVFTCDDVENSPIPVDMYVWDEKGNYDFCTVFLTLVDNNGACGTSGSKATVAGTVATEGGEAVSDAEVVLDANIVEYPKSQMTDGNGAFAFSAPVNNDYTVGAVKDVDYLNGVSTLDLVKIQRHILDLELLDSPYKVIAADVNADNIVKVSDLTVLRKLILGIIDDIPTNTSWRFVDASQELPEGFDLADVKEVVKIQNLTQDMMDNNLVAIKVGDVTGNAIANFVSHTSEVRSGKTLTFDIADRDVVAGETVEVAFSSNDFDDVYGFQFTMELSGLEFAGVAGDAVAMADANVGVIASNVVTVSYNDAKATTAKGEPVFTMNFVATQNGHLGDMIDITSKVTPAEAYVGKSLEIRDVAIEARGENTVDAATELFQNEPNPFKGETSVGFNLAKAGTATVSVLDVTGKVIVVKTIDGVRGYNTVKFTADELGTTGVLYYQLESGDFTATKKMIIIE